MNANTKSQGFSLIEMSIVVLIIALLVGGIMGGRSLIRASEIRNAIGEYDAYLKALKEFQDKYMALPGDMSNATSIWGTDPVSCPNTTYSANPQITTCNGDGNGRIGGSTTAGVLSSQTEWWRAWQQLANAGMIAGSYTGIQGSGGASEAVLGTNAPRSSLTGAGWTLNFYLMTSNGVLWADTYGHLLNLGASATGDYTKNGIMSPADALNIDTKIDDSKPGTGKVRAWRASSLANCTDETVATQAGAIYKMTYLGQDACALVFLLGF